MFTNKINASNIPVIETSVQFFEEQAKFLEIFKEVSPYSYIMIL